jgi:hypothetical protein
MSFWDWVQRFQSAVVGVIGFAGVIITLIVNAHLARTQQDRAIAHDRQMVQVALVAELTKVRDTIKARYDSMMQTPEDQRSNIFISARPMTDVYDHLMDKIGLLDAEQIGKVMDVYVILKDEPKRLRLIERQWPIPDATYGPNRNQGRPLLVPTARRQIQH